MFARVVHALFAPEEGLIFTWLSLTVVAAAVFGPLAGSAVLMGGMTLVLVLMLAVAAYMPPSRPLREVSALAARTSDLIKVASGAALFGAAAAYGGGVGALMSRMPPNEVMSADLAWSVTWPILIAATSIGASVVGLRLGWDFRRSGHRSRLLALGKLRSWLPTTAMEHHPIADWLANVAITGSRTGAFMVFGYLLPAIVVGDVYLGIEYAKLVA